MTGLEKIVKQIEEEAVATAEIMLREAEDKAREITKDAQANCVMIQKEMEERSANDVSSCISRGESAKDLARKKMILKAKQEVISNVIERAKEKLLQLPDDEYFEVIRKMVQKYALEQTGQIMFSAQDMKRVPKAFKDEMKSNLKISEKTANIDGGFILVYGDVEENCSFDALFFATRESLQDQVCEVLFA